MNIRYGKNNHRLRVDSSEVGWGTPFQHQMVAEMLTDIYQVISPDKASIVFDVKRDEDGNLVFCSTPAK